MKKLFALSSIVFIFLFFISCGGSKELADTETGDIPSWYLTTPTADDYIFESASSTSRDMDLAITKASVEARAKVARTLEVKINSMQKKFEEEVGQGENSEFLSQFTQATKTIVSKELTGSQISQKKLVKDGKNWRAYVLAKYPIGAAQKAFLKQISNDENLYARYRATEAFKELENEVQKYDNPDEVQVPEVPQISQEAQIEAPQDTEQKAEVKVDAPEIETVDKVSKNQIINLNDFSFELIACKKENRNITCSLIITNNSENDLNLRLGINSTKIFDESGSEYTANTIKIANSASNKGWSRIEKQIVPNVKTPAEFIFENVSTKTTGISLFSIYVIDGGHEVKFRDIKID